MFLLLFVVIPLQLVLFSIFLQCSSPPEKKKVEDSPAVAKTKTKATTSSVTPKEKPPMTDELFKPDLSIIEEKSTRTGKSELTGNFKMPKNEPNQHRLPGAKYKVVDGKLEQRGKGMRENKSKMGDASSNPLSYALGAQKSKSQELSIKHEINLKNKANESKDTAVVPHEIEEDVYLPADQLP